MTHWAQKNWAACTFWEKCKTVALTAACIGAAGAALVGAFFLRSYRWGGCP